MTQFVEMLRNAPAYQNTAGIIPSTLAKFYEAATATVYWGVYAYLSWDNSVVHTTPVGGFGAASLRGYMPSASFGAWAGSYAGIGVVRANADTNNDHQVVSTWNAFSQGNGDFLIIVRGSGTAAAPTFYALKRSANSNTCRLVKVVAGVETVLAGPFTPTNYGAVDGSRYIALGRLQVTGTTLRFRTWMWDSAEPTTWDMSVTDASIVTGSTKGIGYKKVAGNIDNWQHEFISVGTGTDDAPVPRTLQARRNYFHEGGNSSVIAALLGCLGDDGASGLTAYAPVSTHDFRTKAGDIPANTAFEDILSEVGDFEYKANDQLMGEAEESYGSLSVINTGGNLDRWNKYNWDGREYQVYVGGVDQGSGRVWPWWDFELVNRGTLRTVSWQSPRKLQFELEDPSALLDRLIQTNRYASGPDAILNRVKPLTFGRVFNVRPVLIDAALHKYQVHDGPLTDITDVRENGASIMGSVTKQLAAGTFTLTASPAGDITCDAYSHESNNVYLQQDGSYVIQVSNTAQGIVRVLAGRSSLSIDQKNENPVDPSSLAYAGSNATSGDYAGVYLEDEAKFNEVMTELALSNGFIRSFNKLGRLSLYRFDPSYNGFNSYHTDAMGWAITEGDILERSLYPVQKIMPAKVEHLYGRKNYFPQTTLAGSVTEANRALYSEIGVQSTYAPVESGLDTPNKHLLAREKPSRMTLLASDTSANTVTMLNAEATRLWNIFNHQVVLFGFKTRRYAFEMELGQYLHLTHSRWGLSAGAYGQIVGVRVNPKTRVAYVLWAVRVDGLWPTTTSAYPYLAAGDFQ